MSVMDAISMNGVRWYDVNMTKVQIYFTGARNNYAKLHKSSDSHVKSADSHVMVTRNFLPIDLQDSNQ